MCSTALTFGHLDEAHACSPAEPPYSYAEFGESSPSAGATNVALDTVIAVRVKEHQENTLFADPKLTLRDVTSGEDVPGEVAGHGWYPGLIVFTPSDTLKANHEYVLTAVSTGKEALPEGALTTGDIPAEPDLPRLEVSFSTGASLLPPLTIKGDLSAKLQTEFRPDYSECEDSCGGSCDPNGTISGIGANVVVPEAGGGQSDFGYYYIVNVSANAPNGERTTGSSKVLSGEAGSESLEVTHLDTDTEYTPCFSGTVRDLSGKAVELEPMCLEDSVRTTEPTSSCSITHVKGTSTSSLAWLSIPAALLTFARRTQRKRSTHP